MRLSQAQLFVLAWVLFDKYYNLYDCLLLFDTIDRDDSVENM